MKSFNVRGRSSLYSVRSNPVEALVSAPKASPSRSSSFTISPSGTRVLPMTLFLRKNLSLRSGTTRDRVRMLLEAGEYLAAHGELAVALRA
mgnify:CR=1 FL=1